MKETVIQRIIKEKFLNKEPENEILEWGISRCRWPSEKELIKKCIEECKNGTIVLDEEDPRNNPELLAGRELIRQYISIENFKSLIGNFKK
jgi:hypothetical protein